MVFRKYNKKLGNAFMEYVIILGIVTVALVTMNTYIKRGLQGRVKEMTDYFISNEQVAESSPTAITNSSSTRVSQATISNEGFIGGGTGVGITEATNITATSRTVDTGRGLYIPDLVPSEEGQVTPPDQTQMQAADSGTQTGTGRW